MGTELVYNTRVIQLNPTTFVPSAGRNERLIDFVNRARYFFVFYIRPIFEISFEGPAKLLILLTFCNMRRTFFHSFQEKGRERL